MMTITQKCEVSVIIPAYNEETVIVDTINSVVNYLEVKFSSYEIIIVDDGSTDNTVYKVNELASSNNNIKLQKNKVNCGKGFSVRKGVVSSKGKYVLFSDADLSTPISELEKLLCHINEFPVIIGSRALADSDVQIHQPFYREWMGRVFNKFVQLINVYGLKDTQCGFKLFNGDVARELFSLSQLDGFCFDVEVLFIANKKNYPIKEVPVIWRNDSHSKVSPVSDSARMFLDLIKIRCIHKGLSQDS